MMGRLRAAKDSLGPVHVERGDAAYPESLTRHLGNRAPERIFLLGNPELLQKDSLGLFCSIRCPGNIILKTYDLAKALREAGLPVIGGFQTPMEKECLALLLRGPQPIVICPPRGLAGIRLSAGVKDGVKAGRVLLVSMFGSSHRRATVVLTDQRNRLVAALAGMAFVSHAAPGGKTEALCREVIAMGKPLFAIDAPENANLLSLGAKALAIDDLSDLRGRAAR